MVIQGEEKRTDPRCDSATPDGSDTHHKPAKYIISISESYSAANVSAICDDCLLPAVKGIMESNYTATISGI